MKPKKHEEMYGRGGQNLGVGKGVGYGSAYGYGSSGPPPQNAKDITAKGCGGGTYYGFCWDNKRGRG